MSEVQSVLSWNSIVHEKMDKQTRPVPPPQAGPIQARLCGPREGGGNVFNLLQLSTQQTSYTNNKNKKKYSRKEKQYFSISKENWIFFWLSSFHIIDVFKSFPYQNTALSEVSRNKNTDSQPYLIMFQSASDFRLKLSDFTAITLNFKLDIWDQRHQHYFSINQKLCLSVTS